VHIWRATLDLPPAAHARLWQSLSADEQQRAERLVFARDRQHFSAARGLLRWLLGQYVSAPPHSLRFAYGPRGKPALLRQPGWPDLRFNLAHSHGLALYAVACQRDVGIDLERIRADVEHAQLAERFFAPDEASALRALPPTTQRAAFFQCWASKEAYIKARGAGLALSLQSFAVPLALPHANQEPLAIRATQATQPTDAANGSSETASETARWALYPLAPAAAYAAALVLERHAAAAAPAPTLRCWQLPTELLAG
jgi:4'-phosphopantetheinyl transferase